MHGPTCVIATASLDPIRPVPPRTTIFIAAPFDFVMCDVCWLSARKVAEVGQDRSLKAPPTSGARQLLPRQCAGAASRCRAQAAQGLDRITARPLEPASC